VTTINFVADKASLDNTILMLKNLGRLYSPVVSRAINKTLTTTRAKAVDEIALDLNLTKTSIRNSFTFSRASYSAPRGHVLSISRPVPLIQFRGTRALARGGVSVQVKNSGPRTVLRHAFIATMLSGHKGIFERQEWTNKPWVKGRAYAALPKQWRLPIDELYSLRITDEYGKPEVLNKVLSAAGEAYQKNIDHELSYELSRLN
jgi:hypothetical protein